LQGKVFSRRLATKIVPLIAEHNGVECCCPKSIDIGYTGATERRGRRE